MGKIYKTKEPPISEWAGLHQPAAELKTAEGKHKRAEEALRESEEKYRTIFENVNDVVVRLDKRGKVIDANKRVEDYFGYKPNEIIGKNFIKLGALSPKDLPKIVKLFSERVEGKPLSFIELEVKRKDGSIALLEANTTLIKKDGKIEGTTAIIRDITERKQIEEALQAEKNKLKSVIDAMEDTLTIHDKHYNIIYQSEPSRIIFGDHVGEKCYRVFESEEKVCHGCPVEKAFKDGKSHTSERKVVMPSGEIIFWENTANPIRDARGEVVSCLEVGRNITERRQAENELRKFKTISDKAGYGITIVDLEGNVSYVNKSFAKMHGYTPGEVIGKHLSIFHPEHQMANVNRLIEKLKREGSYVAEELGHKTKDNTEFTTLMNGTLVKDENGTPLFMAGTAVDITERKQAEEALQAEKNKLQSVIDALEYDLTIQDRDFNIIYQNEPSRISSGGDHMGEKCYRVYEGRDKICDGCPVKKAFKDGKSHTEERKRLSPSGEITFWENTANPIRDARGEIVSCLEIGRNITGRKQMEEALKESQEKLERMFESVTEGISVVNLNGAITEANQRTAEMHGFGSKDELIGKSAFELVAPRDHEKIAKNMRQALKQGTVRDQEYTLLKSDGSEFPGELSTSVLKDASGNPVGHVTISRDITERKQAEEREKELQQELHISSRLASIGELAAGVAHQINNPLTGVLGFSQRLLRKSTDQEISQDLGRIYIEAERAAKVVQNLLTFARRREPKKQYSDINEILQSALELRAYELKTSNIEVVTNLAPSLPQIMVDFHQIQEVFLNIVLNAEQVMTEANSGGRLTIKTEEKKGYIRTTFTDDGPGIPAEHLDKLFDPFFSTKGERGGTGLGLSVCHGIISEHGGRIYAKSKLGKGATFFVELPLPVKSRQEVAAPGRCRNVTKMD